jgi:hypothetical protein
MGQKDPDLCERAHCRARWAFLVHGRNVYFDRCPWVLRVCAAHAEPYRRAGELDAVGRRTWLETRRQVSA